MWTYKSFYKNEDLLEYVPKIEKTLLQYGLEDGDLFIKAPIDEKYDEYKNFLIEELYGRNLGYFNEKYDTIILNCPNFYIWKYQKSVTTYKEVIRECCYLICGDNQFIVGDSKDIEKRKQHKK